MKHFLIHSFLPSFANVKMIQDSTEIHNSSRKIVAGNEKKKNTKTFIDLFDQLADQIVVAAPVVQVDRYFICGVI